MIVNDIPITALQFVQENPNLGALSYLSDFCKLDGTKVEIYKVSQVVIVGDPAVILTPFGDILYESSNYQDYPEALRKKVKGSSIKQPNHFLQDTEYCLLCGIWDNEFWHWLMDYIPKALMAEASGFIGRYLVPQKSGFILESLEMIGISQSRLIEYNSRATRVDTLIIPQSIEGFKELPCYPSLVYELRNRLLTSSIRPSEFKFYERIYIARKTPHRPRRVVNEAELLKILDQFSFRKVYMEDFTLREQVGLASCANVLVGPHGAGMLHALFIQPRSLVIEFFSPHYILNSILAAINLLNLRYFNIVGNNGPLWPYKYGEEIKVNLELFELTLKIELDCVTNNLYTQSKLISK